MKTVHAPLSTKKQATSKQHGIKKVILEIINSKLLIMFDLIAMFAVAAAPAIDGWSKLSAIGILGALLAIMLYRLPEVMTRVSEPHRQAYQQICDTQEKSTDKLIRAIEVQTSKIDAHQSNHLDLLRAFLDEKDKRDSA